jgi:hypothetical protein
MNGQLSSDDYRVWNIDNLQGLPGLEAQTIDI